MTASDDLKNEITETERIYLFILSLFYFGRNYIIIKQ